MTTKTATRRSFMTIAGAALSAPVAAAAATLPGRVEPDPLNMRLATFQDLNEIRGVNQAYLQSAAAGAHEEMAALFDDPRNASRDPEVRGFSPADFGERDVIEVAQDRQTATARLHVVVHTETAIDPDCTLLEMAKLQGEGVVRLSAPAVLEHTYVRRTGAWKILHSTRRMG